MRKMKKINGFLVVRFNDREKRNYPTLGNFGVIDADDYTGDIDFDLDAMEYTDADLIEIAVEQARGLNAEEDFSDEPTTYTVIAETADEAREEEVAPKAMALSWEEQLKTQVKSKHYPDIDPRTAAHELNGYKAALRDLGLLEADEAIVEPDAFGPACEPEETLAYVCDELCRFREGRTQEELDAICEKCKLESWARGRTQEPGARYHLGKPGSSSTQEEDSSYYPGKLGAGPYHAAALGTASPQEPKPRTGFDHLPEEIGYSLQTKRIYALGLVLADECPDNDCKVYLNVFNMARELDDAIGEMDDPDSYPALVLRQDLHKQLRELGQMYYENYAIQKFKEGMKA